MDVEVIQRTIDDFLKQQIEKEIEAEQKKLKDKLNEEQIKKIYNDYEIESWINYIAENAPKVSLNVSHVAKLTHSSSKAISLNDVIKQTKYLYLITTQTANISELDNSYSDAQYSRVAKFLSYPVENSSKNLGQYLAQDEKYFSKISSNQNERQTWQQKISQAYSPKELSSHVFAKQVYIPVGNDTYNLVSPVKSSSLAHKIFDVVSQSKDKKNEIYKAYNKKQWHGKEYMHTPKTAFLGVTKSNPQNVSKLNVTRRGGLYLFSSIPPLWEQKLKPPKNIEHFLARCLTGDNRDIFEEIKRFLYVVKTQQLSINLQRKLILVESITGICDNIFNQILLTGQSNFAGWSNNFELPLFLKAFLDPSSINQQEISKQERQLYIDEFIQQVAKWISYHIDDKKRETRLENLWIKIMRPLFRDFYAVITAE